MTCKFDSEMELIFISMQLYAPLCPALFLHNVANKLKIFARSAKRQKIKYSSIAISVYMIKMYVT